MQHDTTTPSGIFAETSLTSCKSQAVWTRETIIESITDSISRAQITQLNSFLLEEEKSVFF